MTDSYHKARKSYGLFSALLIAWVLIGIELTPEPVESLNIKIKTPEVVPYVLLILVIYFAYRFTIEWLLINEEGRKIPPAKIDFYVAHGIGFLSIIIWLFQTLTEIQIGKQIVENRDNIAIVFLFSFLMPFLYFFMVKSVTSESFKILRTIQLLFFVLLFAAIMIAVLVNYSDKIFLIIIATACGILNTFLLKILRKKIPKLNKFMKFMISRKLSN